MGCFQLEARHQSLTTNSCKTPEIGLRCNPCGYWFMETRLTSVVTFRISLRISFRIPD